MYKNVFWPNMVAYTINISTTEAEAVGSLEFEASLNT